MKKENIKHIIHCDVKKCPMWRIKTDAEGGLDDWDGICISSEEVIFVSGACQQLRSIEGLRAMRANDMKQTKLNSRSWKMGGSKSETKKS